MPPPSPPPSAPDAPHWRWGSNGQSCDQACAGTGFDCNAAALAQITDIESFQALADAYNSPTSSAAVTTPGGTAPGAVSTTPFWDHRHHSPCPSGPCHGFVVPAGGTPTCAAGGNHRFRLCRCGPMPPPPPSPPTLPPAPPASPINCNERPLSMNPNTGLYGCAGAVWESGAPSETYCNGVDPTDAGRDWKWWEVCCVWGVRVGEPDEGSHWRWSDAGQSCDQACAGTGLACNAEPMSQVDNLATFKDLADSALNSP